MAESNRNTAVVSLSPKGGAGSHELTVETAEREQLGSWTPSGFALPPLLGVGSTAALRAMPEHRELLPSASSTDINP